MSLEASIPRINQQISSNGQPGAAIAYLGQFALSDPEPAELFSQTASLISQVLGIDFILIWELDPAGNHLLLRGSSGWSEESDIPAQMHLDPDRIEGFILNSPYPMLLDNLPTETRFKTSGLLMAHGIVSGMGMTLGTVQKPYGMIEIFSPRPRTFLDTDIHFLQSLANVLALFIDSKRNATQRSEQQLNKPLRPGNLEWEHSEIKSSLVESRERERLHLAQELHDIPIQDLYGLMYQLDDLRDPVQNSTHAEAVESFNFTLNRVVNSLRSICGELRPPSLSPFGLEVAIRDHVERVHKQYPYLQIHLDLKRDQQMLTDSIRLCLFRIYQQAINNVVRHAQATDVYIRFDWDEDMLRLEVEDNGSGFEVPPQWLDLVQQEHFGLVGLAERVESVNGKLEIISAPGDGTTIRVWVPRR